MASRFEDFIEATQHAPDIQTLNELLLQEVSAEGYDNLVVARASRKAVDVLCAVVPTGYHDMYFGNSYEHVDPILRLSRKAIQPFLWDGAINPAKISKKESVFFAECKDIGVYGGLTMPFHSPNGDTHVMSVSLREGHVPNPKRIPYIYALASQTWVRHAALITTDAAPEPVYLTDRERECLVWAKDGKTNWEISQILSLSERTVEFHIGNVIRKLKATNKVTAIVIAIQEGVIDF